MNMDDQWGTVPQFEEISKHLGSQLLCKHAQFGHEKCYGPRIVLMHQWALSEIVRPYRYPNV